MVPSVQIDAQSDACEEKRVEVKISLFEEKNADPLSRMIYDTIQQMEKASPKLDYSLVRQEDTPEELVQASKNGLTWIAWMNDKIVGTVSLNKTRVRRLFVHPAHQRHGIGRALMATLIRYARVKKIRQLHVRAVLKAVDFYEKVGFKKGKIILNPEINQPEMNMRFVLKR